LFSRGRLSFDQIVSWTITDAGGGSEGTPPPTSIAGYTDDWDTIILDGIYPTTPGPDSWFYHGPEIPNASSGSLHLVDAGNQGCHTVHLAAWLNTGQTTGADQTYGPLCCDTIPPVTSVTVTPNAPNGWNNTTVQIGFTAAGSSVRRAKSGIDQVSARRRSLASQSPGFHSA
jgi:hypothetical protein